MGFGLPAALGAQAAFPDRLVVDIDGDGSFQMTMQDLAACVQYNLPVKVFIINNRYLGMVRQWQELFYGGKYSQVDLEVQPDFVKLAEAFGATGLRAERPSDVRPSSRKPSIRRGRWWWTSWRHGKRTASRSFPLAAA